MIKLNIGCFFQLFEYNWINIDILDLRRYIKNNYIFKCIDIRRGIPYSNNTVDLIYTSHFIEHLTIEECIKFLEECYRVMKNKSVIKIATPDLEILINNYINNTMNKFNKIQPKIYSEYETNGLKFSAITFSGHKSIYDYESIENILYNIGFSDIKRTSYNNSRSKIIKEETYDTCPEVSLYVEAIK